MARSYLQLLKLSFLDVEIIIEEMLNGQKVGIDIDTSKNITAWIRFIKQLEMS